MGGTWELVGALLRLAVWCAVILSPGVFFLWLYRRNEPSIWRALWLPLTWVTPVLAAVAWTELSIGDSTKPLYVVFACLLAQAFFSAFLILKLAKARLVTIVWALLNVPFGLLSALQSALGFTGQAI